MNNTQTITKEKRDSISIFKPIMAILICLTISITIFLFIKASFSFKSISPEINYVPNIIAVKWITIAFILLIGICESIFKSNIKQFERDFKMGLINTLILTFALVFVSLFTLFAFTFNNMLVALIFLGFAISMLIYSSYNEFLGNLIYGTIVAAFVIWLLFLFSACLASFILIN